MKTLSSPLVILLLFFVTLTSVAQYHPVELCYDVYDDAQDGFTEYWQYEF